MKSKYLKRFLALGLACTMVLGSNTTSAYAVGSESVEDNASAIWYEKLDADNVTAETWNTESVVEEESSLETYADSDEVRAIVVLEDIPAVALMSDDVEAGDDSITAYRETLEAVQDEVAGEISEQVLDGEELDVVWNLTLITNAMSVNVEYGKLEAISQVEGVKAVYVEIEYQPMEAETNNIVAQEMTGADVVKQDSGYTGAGTRIAVVDTGTDTDHQSFSEGGYEYALALEAEKKGMTYEEYVDSLNLLSAAEIGEKLTQLNCYSKYEGLTADDLYLSNKLPFNFNYIDCNLDVTHDNDAQGEHGSHVAGISTANSYIDCENVYDFNEDGKFDKEDAQALMDFVICGTGVTAVEFADINGDGAITAYDAYCLLKDSEAYAKDGAFYVSAADTVAVTGVAPEAQLITMKVFGAGGGAYTSDYMAAVEDAIFLECDTVNLSLGGAWPGFSGYHSNTDSGDDITVYVDGIMEYIEQTGTVMCVAAGNAGTWAENDDAFGYMYTDEGGTSMTSDPATYNNSFSVASAENVGSVSDSVTSFYSADGSVSAELSLETVAEGLGSEWKELDATGAGTEYDIVFLGNPSDLFAGNEQIDETIYAGYAEDFEGYDYTGKIVVVARGNQVSFADKHTNAGQAGAAAVLIYNNVAGSISASISGTTEDIPCAGLTLDNAKALFALCEADENGVYTAKASIVRKINIDHGEDVTYPAMSDFSSWGSTGALTIKPEITAPGGNIYSVNGALEETDGYELMSGTSMATPHVAGLVALASQYVKENDVLAAAKNVSGNDDLTTRTLVQSLLMSTAEPLIEESTKVEYSVRNQGSGLADIENVIKAESFVMVDGQSDGKVKAELGDGTDGWSFSFTLNNLTGEAITYDLDASILTTDTLTAEDNGNTYYLSSTEMTTLGAGVNYSGTGVKNGKVTLPANGTATITVSIEVTNAAIENMKALGYENGFYVEGYIYAKPETSSEGKVGVTHSIPVLGWYGNWTDISMYDTGSYLEIAYGLSERPSHIDSSMKNVLTWCPEGASTGYYYTGNIYGAYYYGILIGDQRYIEARNAFNSEDSQWSFYAIFPTLIRNAADFKLEVEDAETGELYYHADYDGMDKALIGSFYYANAAQWMDTTSDYGIGFDWNFTDSDGNTLPEGTKVKVSLCCAPEYYLGEDKVVTDWSELGKGAELSWMFEVDNTYPDLQGDNPLTVEYDEEGNPSKLNFNVQDNNYIAAVLLLNGTASEAAEYYYPDMDEDARGQEVSGSFDLESYVAEYGKKAAIAICDYAGNETYYALNLAGEGSPLGEFVAFQYDPEAGEHSWVAFDENVNMNESQIFLSGEKFVCAEYVNGYVFAQREDGRLYAFPYSDLLANTLDLEKSYVASLDNVYQDFAYNYADGYLYGLYIYESERGAITSYINKINLVAGEYGWPAAYTEDWVMQRDEITGFGLAVDDEGTLYIVGTEEDEETGKDSNARLYSASLEENRWGGVSYSGFEMVGDTGIPTDYLQSITWNHNNESLYWARFYPVNIFTLASELYEINPETGAATKCGDLSNETGCLMSPLTDEAAALDGHQNVPVFDTSIVGTPVLSTTTITLNVGGTDDILYTLDPWYTAYKDVTFKSSDESVATVDEKGHVTAVASGSCKITVASVQDPSLAAECSVSVASLSLSFDGVISHTDGGVGVAGESKLYTFEMTDGIASIQTGNEITAPEEYQGYGLDISTAVNARGSIFASEWGNTGMMYQIDAETGEVQDMLSPIDGDMMFGLDYSSKTDLFTGIMNYYLYVDIPMTHESEDDMINSYDPEKYEFTWHKFDMSEYLDASQGNLVTSEEGTTDIVFCGITAVDGDGTLILPEGDYLGGYNLDAVYVPDTTHVLLDNVGRLWYIDEITGMTMGDSEYGERYIKDLPEELVSEWTPQMHVSIGANGKGTFAQEYQDEDGNTTYSVFVIREIAETPAYDMFLNGQLGITYSFSDICYAGKALNGKNMYVLSLYDYWGNAATNEIYLYIEGGDLLGDDHTTWPPIYSKGDLYHLGDTGFGNLIATVQNAQVTGGLEFLENEDTAEYAAAIYKSYYTGQTE